MQALAIEAKEPYYRQGSEAAVFSVEVEDHRELLCAHCRSSVLIEHYCPENFLRVRIQCYRCGRVTETPGLPDGEILPHGAVTSGSAGVILLKSTVSIRATQVLTCDEEVEREQARTRPHAPVAIEEELSEEAINRWEVLYDRVTDGCLEKHKASALRGIKHTTQQTSEYPFAWACLHLRRRLVEKEIDISPGSIDAAALGSVLSFKYFVEAWGNHPRFAEIGRTFRGTHSFHHNIALFAAASNLLNVGNRIGIGLATEGARTADLYVRSNARDQLRVEVKAPVALNRLGTTLDAYVVEEAVKQALKSAHGQVNRKHRGILVISSDSVHPGSSDLIKRGIAEVMRSKGRDHRGVAACIGICPIGPPWSGHRIRGFGYNLVMELNPHFEGQNPVQTLPRPIPRLGEKLRVVGPA